MSKRITITAALPYTNGPIHIGHLAGVYVPADIYARYLRLQGKVVAFICGSDEHGVPITLKARNEKVSPQIIVDKYDAIIRKSFIDFGISFDNYSRTSAPIHNKTASEFFKELYKKGVFIEDTTKQLFDNKSSQFLADRFVVGTCPKCGYDESYGDQCENCGTSHNATDLIKPKSAITGTKPDLKETKHWFLPLNHYQNFLKKWILDGHKTDWKPNVYGQVKSWLDDGLKPRAVTRDLDWGIPVPVEGGEGKVLYVWFDAPIGYISSTIEWAQREGIDWKPFWKDPKTKLIHFIGKDNIVFHCIIFPVMLKAHGDFILPENVPANEFLNLEGHKLSTSKNWAVWLHEYIDDFPNKQDVLRYVLTANAPETKDNDFTWSDFQARNNNELVAIFGNLVNRVIVLTHKYFEGKVPKPNEITEVDEQILKEVRLFPETISNAIERFKFRLGSQELMNLARLGNKYLADQEPWKIIKTDISRVETIIYVALQITAALAILSEPFLPFTAIKLNRILRAGSSSEDNTWNGITEGRELLPSNHEIGEAELLFSKIEDAEIQNQLEKLKTRKYVNQDTMSSIKPQKELISFEDFTKLDIRVGMIIAARKITKTKKLLELKVDIGIGIRTIISGIAEFYSPKDIIGKRVSVLVNLAPRMLRGIKSEGTILMSGNANGELVFINPEDSVDVVNGAPIS